MTIVTAESLKTPNLVPPPLAIGPAHPWLVQHRRRARRSDVPNGPESAADIESTPFWCLWSQRHYPWALLEVGTPVLLLDSWSSGSLLTWRVEAVDVLRVEIESRDEAVEQIARWTGEDPAGVANSGYLQGSPVERGVVLGWRARPLTWLGFPRPIGLRLDRHGWATVRDEDLRSWGVDLGTGSGLDASTGRETEAVVSRSPASASASASE